MGFSVIRLVEAIIGAIIGGLVILFVGYVNDNPTIVNNLKQYSVSSNFLLVGIFIGIVILIILLVSQLKKNRRNYVEDMSNIPAMFVEYIEIATMKYEDAIWKILQPRSGANRSSHIIVGTKPRCPNCQTELIETRNSFGKYVWKCVRSDFSKTKKHNFIYYANLLVRDARRSWEEGRLG